MRRTFARARGALVLTLLAFAPMRAIAQDSTSTRAGRRPRLAVADEINLARSAAPPGVSDSARVLVLGDTGYVPASGGSNGVTCLVNRSWRDSLEPHCYDAEGTATVLPIELLRFHYRERGESERTIAARVAAGIANGHFRLPVRPALTYMMSAGQVLYDDDGTRAGAWRPHLMIYYPRLTGAQVGMSGPPDMRVGMVSEEGTAESNLMIVMSAFIPVRGREHDR